MNRLLFEWIVESTPEDGGYQRMHAHSVLMSDMKCIVNRSFAKF